MPDVLSITISALQADQSRLDAISRNAANAATPGYRRSVQASMIFDSVLDAKNGSPISASNVVSGQENAVAPVSALFAPALKNGIDSTQAGLIMTGRPLDLAVDGVGFFAVSDVNGLALTRAGAFSVDASGWLVNALGGRVQGRGGDVHVGAGKTPSVDGLGRITVDGQLIDVLRLMKAQDGDTLTSRDGLSLVSNSGEYVAADPAKVTVRAGYLEASNATGVRESVGMVETMRHYEGLIRLYQGYDEAMGKTIQKLGDL